MALRSRLSLTFCVAFLIATPLHAGLLGDLWDGVKSVVSAPVRAVGWLVGQGVDAAVDPALDNAFGRLKDTTDHAIDRLDSVSASRIGQLDDVAKERIKQLDDVAKKRIDQVDEVLKNRLDQTDRILDKQLNHLEEVGTQLLDREAKILDENVTRVEDILDRSLDRLQEIETDAFDRVDSALQDQVPFAAGQVARTVEWTAAIIVFIVVLVGFGGVELLRRIQTDKSEKRIWGKLIGNLAYVPRALLLVGAPMLFLFGVIQLGYFAYCNRADVARIARVEDAANLLEMAGDFKAATAFRKRAFALDGKDRRHYMVMRDQWLTAFWQKHIGQDTVELLQRLNYLRTDRSFVSFSDSDSELQAAAIYLRASYTAESSATELSSSIKNYKETFVSKKLQPVLGKLVFMSEAKLILNDGVFPIDTRLKNAAVVVDNLLAFENYKRYAPGLVLRSQISVHQLELEADRLKPSIAPEGLEARLKIIRADVEAAFAADQNLARYIRFRSKPLPKELADNVRLWSTTAVDARKDLKDARGALLAEIIPRQFDEYASELERIIKPLLGVDLLSRSKVERQILYSMRSSLGELQLKEQIVVARKTMLGDKGPSERYKACSAVADTAAGLGKLQLAEAWLNESSTLISASPDAFVKNESQSVATRLDDLRTRSGHPKTTDLDTTRLTDVMFYVF